MHRAGAEPNPGPRPANQARKTKADSGPAKRDLQASTMAGKQKRASLGRGKGFTPIRPPTRSPQARGGQASAGAVASMPAHFTHTEPAGHNRQAVPGNLQASAGNRGGGGQNRPPHTHGHRRPGQPSSNTRPLRPYGNRKTQPAGNAGEPACIGRNRGNQTGRPTHTYTAGRKPPHARAAVFATAESMAAV